MMLLLQDEASIGQEAAKQPDISPLIAMEQSSSDVSAADLAGRPAASLQDPINVPAAISESSSMSEGRPYHSLPRSNRS